MKVSKLLLLFGIAISSCTNIFSQTAQRFLPVLAPPSPEAAAFARYGNYQVNLFTGIPEISIPLYEIKVGELRVPVSLNYHASGMKVTDIPSRAGLGWDLQAGGSITRKIMGKPDDLPNNYLLATVANDNIVKTQAQIDVNSDAGLNYLERAHNGQIDLEPDIFSYSFPGHGGKFLFNQKNNYAPVLIPYAPVAVNMTVAPNNLQLGMTDESGINYKFDTKENSITGAGINVSAISAWLLSDMISANKQDTVHFTYTVRNTPNGNTDSYFSDYMQLSDNCTGSYNDGIGCTPGGSYFTDAGSVSTTWQQMTQIDFKNGRIVFEAAPESRLDFSQQFYLQNRLSAIKIYTYDALANTYNLIRTIKFYHSYFIKNADPKTQRLRLDSLQVLTSAGSAEETYRFDYNNNVLLPDKDSRSKDYWGYFNNQVSLDPNGNPTMVPRMQVQFKSIPDPSPPTMIWIGGNNINGREPDPNYMQACILQKITFPTGGNTQFEYETNQYLDAQSNPKYAGGLRIKSIKSYPDNTAAPIVKTYKYGANESGYGRNNFLLEDHFFVGVQNLQKQKDLITQADGSQVCAINSNTKTLRTYFSNPTNDLESYDGAPVVYANVTEYTGDGTSNTGKTMYTFSDITDGKTTVIGLGKPILTSYHFVRGLLNNRSDYRRNANGTYSIVAENRKTFQYFPFENTTGGIGLVVFKAKVFEGYVGLTIVTPCETSTDKTSFNFNNYELTTGDNKLVSETGINYDQNDPTRYTSVVSNYTYDDKTHLALATSSTTNSKGETLAAYMTYPYNYSTSPYTDMTASHIFDKVITERKTNNNKQLSLQQTNFASFAGNNYLPANIQLQVKSNPMEARALFNNYDPRGNITEMQKPGDALQGVIWGYNNVYPVAMATNAANNTHLVPSPLTTTSSLSVPVNSFAQQTMSFATSYVGAITITLPAGAWLGSQGIVTLSGPFVLTGPSGAAGNICYSSQAGTCAYANTYTYVNMPVGNYTLVFTANTNNAAQTAFIQVSYQGVQYNPVGVTEFFYQSFEETAGATNGTAHTGNYFWNGNYTVPFTLPNSRAYTMQWWNLSNGIWKFNQQAYTGSILLTGPVDDIRVFPTDAQMTSYTYTPLIGMTSQTDPAGKTTYYEYDNFLRVKNIKDFQGNIVKNFRYNYRNSCGANCFILPMQTMNGSNTISYPVGVFNVSGQLLSNATTQAQYVSTWNGNATNQAVGVLSAGADSMHFNLQLNTGQTVPYAVTGLRYYQVDLDYTMFDAVRIFNGEVVDFGDGISLRIGNTFNQNALPANTSVNYFSGGTVPYIVHTYPNNNLKTITFYHNDVSEFSAFDNFNNPSTALSKIKNFRGNLPQYIPSIGGSGYQQATMNSVAGISNWSNINSVIDFIPHNGDGISPSTNMNYVQDFMANNKGLKWIRTSIYGPYRTGYRDTTFKISRLKSNWNTYFTSLETIQINEDHWNHEDLSALKKLSTFWLLATTTSHTDVNGQALIPLSAQVIDNVINQIANGAGNAGVINGSIAFTTGGTARTSASNAAVNQLKSAGWTITLNGTAQ